MGLDGRKPSICPRRYCWCPKLIHRLIVDAAAIVATLVVVPVALVGAAELEEVIALQHAHVIANHVVLTIPETGAGVLRVDVVRAE